MKKITSFLFITLLANLSLISQNFSENSTAIKSLSFKENKGQVSDQNYKPRPDVLFSGNTGDLVFHLKNNGISYQLNRVDEWVKKEEHHGRKNDDTQLVSSKSTIYRVDINWLNANPSPEIKKGNAQQGYENYYLESCPEGALQVKSFLDITYKNLYPGIDLKWYEKNGSLEYDYYVSANSDYTKIQLEYKGAEKIYVDRSGMLIIKTPLGIIKEQKPLVMQNNKPLEANWIVKNNIVSFEIKNVNSSLTLIIDPAVRLWGTYYGGSANDNAYYTYANSAGEVFLSGSTASSANIATTGAHQTIFAGATGSGDGYIVKFDANGIRIWATYYGGTGHDYACESIEDANGYVFLTGGTQSAGAGIIATPGAHQTAYSTATTNTGDAFLVKFDQHGVRQWGTYYGGDGLDFGNGISLDNNGNVFISGASESTSNIATPGSQQPALFSGQDCFLAKFNSSGVRQWGTYFGGNSGADVSADCVTNSSGDTYITGATSSTVGISTPGCHQPVFGGGPTPAGDGFLAKYNSAGMLQWATYCGGTGSEFVNNLALDASGDIYCGGWTSSVTNTAIATVGSHQSTFGGAYDATLVKFNPAGVRQWGTYYGGSGNDYGTVSIDNLSGNVYLSGDASTNTGTSIATPCSYQPHYGGGSGDAFLAKFTNGGQRIWGTYYGGAYTEVSYCSHADGLGNIYLSGVTLANSGTVIASSNGFQTAGGGGQDAFLVKFDGCLAGSATNLTPPSKQVVCAGTSATLSATCGNWYSSPTATNVLFTGGTFTTGAITSDSTFYVEDFGCGSITGTRTAVSITVAPLPTLTITNSNPLGCVGETITLTASGASTYSWINTSASTPTIQFIVLLNTNYTVTGTDANGCQSTAILAVLPNLCAGINEQRNINSSVSIFPNPNNGAFTIQSGNNLNLVLTNELGQTIRSLTLSSVNNFQVTLNDLPNGIYFLKGEKENYGLNKKIIVIR